MAPTRPPRHQHVASLSNADSSIDARRPSAGTDSLYSPAQFTDDDDDKSSASDATSLSSMDDPSNMDSTLTDQLATSRPHRPLVPGFYVPTLAFFDEQTEDLDLKAVARHAVRLVRNGITGLCTQGSNGEAVHLTHSERRQVTRTTRQALDDAGFSRTPIIVGCGAQSTRETVALCCDAHASGGDYALVLAPAYYKPMLPESAVLDFYREVSDASPVPILIYNYPAVTGGLDLSSDAIIELAKHPNIVGCKLTCGNTGKLARIAAATKAITPSQHLTETRQGKRPSSGFMCMGGSADFTLQTLLAGGSGIVGGCGNVAPTACSRLIDMYCQTLSPSPDTSKRTIGDAKDGVTLLEAQRLQTIVARGDWACIKQGIVGTKVAVQEHFGYGGGLARRPLPRIAQDRPEWRSMSAEFTELIALERRLEGEMQQQKRPNFQGVHKVQEKKMAHRQDRRSSLTVRQDC